MAGRDKDRGRLRAQRAGRNEDASQPSGLKGKNHGSFGRRIFQHPRLRTDVRPLRPLLLLHTAALRHGPVRESLDELDESPDRARDKRLAEPERKGGEHERRLAVQFIEDEYQK